MEDPDPFGAPQHLMLQNKAIEKSSCMIEQDLPEKVNRHCGGVRMQVYREEITRSLSMGTGILGEITWGIDIPPETTISASQQVTGQFNHKSTKHTPEHISDNKDISGPEPAHWPWAIPSSCMLPILS